MRVPAGGWGSREVAGNQFGANIATHSFCPNQDLVSIIINTMIMILRTLQTCKSCTSANCWGTPSPPPLWLRAGNCWHAKPVGASQLASQHALTPHGPAHTIFSPPCAKLLVFRRLLDCDPDGEGLLWGGAGGHLGNFTDSVTHT